jgi:ElaB/YqjD/DUF883 family membrane-anchored ribosome-binding protein
MADMPEHAARPENSQADLQRQIEDLRSDVAKMRDSISAILEDASERASDLYDGAARTATWAGSRLKDQAHSISETVQENPAAISSAFVLGGIVGLFIGMAFGQADRHRRIF